MAPINDPGKIYKQIKSTDKDRKTLENRKLVKATQVTNANENAETINQIDSFIDRHKQVIKYHPITRIFEVAAIFALGYLAAGVFDYFYANKYSLDIVTANNWVLATAICVVIIIYVIRHNLKYSNNVIVFERTTLRDVETELEKVFKADIPLVLNRGEATYCVQDPEDAMRGLHDAWTANDRQRDLMHGLTEYWKRYDSKRWRQIVVVAIVVFCGLSFFSGISAASPKPVVEKILFNNATASLLIHMVWAYAVVWFFFKNFRRRMVKNPQGQYELIPNSGFIMFERQEVILIVALTTILFFVGYFFQMPSPAWWPSDAGGFLAGTLKLLSGLWNFLLLASLVALPLGFAIGLRERNKYMTQFEETLKIKEYIGTVESSHPLPTMMYETFLTKDKLDFYRGQAHYPQKQPNQDQNNTLTLHAAPSPRGDKELQNA